MAVDHSDPAAPVISVGGDLAFTTSGPLRAEVDRVLVERPPVLVLDFAGLHFIDSTGLSVIVHAWREGQQVGTAVRLRSTPRFLDTILDMTGVTGLLARPLPAARTGPAAADLPGRAASA
ncbi:STAS domain-containing protein [Micromonospora purpureochromogenes]|uniref:Anti-sigma B factor antagonist n=1 Tax=Micromonospora purpureochromogenes TaxID=47872 RepID=A0ABX2RUA8_9ACTN|nr:STAS domain-containing protein [Micromonospora purpureochromogenes]NYF58691.1 anti-sigma B factor antagonist [Micromonospora purpureochromogenes]